MQLNIANELTSPKKILSLTLAPELTIGDLIKKLIDDKMISFSDTNSIQVWQSTLKLFSSDVTLKDSTLVEGDTLILRMGPKFKLDDNDKYVKAARESGFTSHMILAAVANADGKTDKAMPMLLDAAAGMDGYQSDDEDEFLTAMEYIKIALEHLKNKPH